jgi:hypothetical protein
MKKASAILIVLAAFLLSAAGIAHAATISAQTDVNLINQNPDPATAANVVEVRLGVENLGGTSVSNFIVAFVPQYPFSAISGENYADTIPTLNAHQQGTDQEIVKFKVAVDKDASAGQYPLKIKTYAAGQEGSSTSYSFNVSVGGSASAESITLDKTTLTPGKEEMVTFTLTNTGSAPLKDLTFTWANSDGVILPVGSDNRNYVKYVDIGQSVYLPYKMMANSGATAGLYQMALTLTYYDTLTNSQKTISSIAGMYVGGGTDFDVAFSDTSSGQTSFTIANIGSNPATSVSVVIPMQPAWSTTGPNSAIVGNLNTGDYTVVSFTLQQSANQTRNAGASRQPGQAQNFTRFNQSQSGNLRMQIMYTDTSGTRQTVEKEVALSQSSRSATLSTASSSGAQNFQGFGRARQESFFAKYKYYIIVFALIAVVVVGGFYYARYKKEKLINPNFRVRDMFMKKKKIIMRK